MKKLWMDIYLPALEEVLTWGYFRVSGTNRAIPLC